MQLGIIIAHSAAQMDQVAVVLVRNVCQVLQLHNAIELLDEVIYTLDVPYSVQDPVTGEWAHGFESGWKVTIR